MARLTDDQIVESLDIVIGSLYRHYRVLEQMSRLHPAVHSILSNVSKPEAINLLERLRYAIKED